MLFNSYAFAFVFLPITLAVFFAVGRWRREWAAGWLALASLVFYGYWSLQYVPLLLGSVIFNFLCGRSVSKHALTKRGRHILAVAVTADLLLLGFYKYVDFFLATTNDLAGSALRMLKIVLPIGISFFSFTQIAFLVDAYRGIAREYKFTHYLLFATYFPHLIAGPILHHSQIMPQFQSPVPYRFSVNSLALGTTFFTIGLAKKVLIADHFALSASPVFDAAQAGQVIPLIAAWAGVFSYAFQLYFDFSGYTDMAIGLSKMFGVDLPINFFSPYKSGSIIEFWQRWHMTLSRFLRDYLYFPLGGNRKGVLRRYINLLATMLLGGLWHGANYTFLVWGGLHGAFLVVNHAWRSLRARLMVRTAPPACSSWGRVLSCCATFLCVSIAWVFFRSTDLPAAFTLLRAMAGIPYPMAPGIIGPPHPLLARGLFESGLVFFGAAILVWGMPNTSQIGERLELAFSQAHALSWYRRAVPITAGAVLALALMEMRQASSFLYFQF